MSCSGQQWQRNPQSCWSLCQNLPRALWIAFLPLLISNKSETVPAIFLMSSLKVWSKWQRCLFSISKWAWFSQHSLGPTFSRLWMAYPALYPLNCLTNGLGCLFLRGSFLYNSLFLVTLPFGTFAILAATSDIPLSPPILLFSHGPTQCGHVHFWFFQLSLCSPFYLQLTLPSSYLLCS